ncbi:SIS domain-containing protein [Gammaproteobacteria bacterium]|nr:SIS domain-containing protein [Gammaproteobacteria bacterium]
MNDRLNNDYSRICQLVTGEIVDVLSKVRLEEVDSLVQEILAAEKIFLIGVGRVFLALQCLGKRLAHFGLDVNIVGSIVEKPISKRDVILVASGSGESMYPLSIAHIAKTYGARVAIITSAESSNLKELSDTALHLPCPTKFDLSIGTDSIQPMSTLFDQCLHVFGDILCMVLQDTTEQSNEELFKNHANLE